MARAPLPAGFVLLQVTPRLDGGGVEAVTLDISRAVAAAGGRSLVASQGGVLEEQLIKHGGELLRLPVHAKSPFTLATNAARLARLIRREGVSLVHVRSRAPAFSALWAARAAGAPIVATYHGIYAARSPLKRWYNGVMTRGDLVIANSEFTRRHILAAHRIDPARVAVAPEGIDTRLFDPARVSPERVAAQRTAWGLPPEDRAPIILQAARLTGWKGQRLAIAALAGVEASRDAILILAGKAESAGEADALRAFAAQAGLGDRVRLVGPLADMPAAYLAADLVIAPSTSPESFGRGVVEACAMGRLVLASPLGAPGETIADGDTGWLVDAGDPNAWTDAISAALDLTPQARGEIGARARARVARLYSLEAMEEAHFAIYQRLTAGRS
jgi:glycosyltransferase involved in cell wall biosynthesis